VAPTVAPTTAPTATSNVCVAKSRSALVQAFTDTFSIVFVSSTYGDYANSGWYGNKTRVIISSLTTDEKIVIASVDDSSKDTAVGKEMTFAINHLLDPTAAAEALTWVQSEFDKIHANKTAIDDSKTFGHAETIVRSYLSITLDDGTSLPAGIELIIGPCRAP
jgi:hypothetical protein